MNFSQLLNSIDELLYEIMSWLVFYPVTLWRILTRPLSTMEYADDELGQSEEEQYTDALSPPLLLLISLLISHMLELALLGDSSLVGARHGIAALIDDDTSLLILRLIVFSLFPIVFATRMVMLQRRPLTRDTLRQPFYSQCYAAAPFALLISLAATLNGYRADGYLAEWAPLVAVTCMTVAVVWYLILQTRWFARMAGIGIVRAAGQALLAMFVSLVLLILVAAMIVGPTLKGA